jgi:AraC-like DNA-binding protein
LFEDNWAADNAGLMLHPSNINSVILSNRWVQGNYHGMKKQNCTYKPHLAIEDFSISPKEEWSPRFSGWTFIRVKQGSGYYLDPQLNQELETGTVLGVGEAVTGKIRASQLCKLSLCTFSVIPARLAGLITLNEQRFLELAASRKESSLQIFLPQSEVASQMDELLARPNRSGLSFRLGLLQVLAEVFGNQLGQLAGGPKMSNAQQRLELFLKQTPSSELLEIGFSDLARMTNCTSRHLSRIFYKLVGMSFNDMRSELRLTRATELLATSHLKVVDVALESGFKSLSQFNQMFTRRFGASPGKWRHKNGRNGNDQNDKKIKRVATPRNSSPVFHLNAFGKPASLGKPETMRSIMASGK